MDVVIAIDYIKILLPEPDKPLKDSEIPCCHAVDGKVLTYHALSPRVVITGRKFLSEQR